MMEYLSDTLAQDKRRGFEQFLVDNPEYRKQFEELSQTWNRVDLSAPNPSEEMDERFFEMLHTEIRETKKSKSASRSWLTTISELLWKPQIAYGVLLVALGVMGGYLLNSDDDSEKVPTTIVSNPSEMEKVRERLVLTLLEQPSANKRLQAVNEASKLDDANERVIEALFSTLNSDPNINVRLVTVESLAKYAETPEVRMGLVKSIGLQDSPLVQIALADLMVALQEKTSVESMRRLLQKPDLDDTVKKKLEESINHII